MNNQRKCPEGGKYLIKGKGKWARRPQWMPEGKSMLNGIDLTTYACESCGYMDSRLILAQDK